MKKRVIPNGLQPQNNTSKVSMDRYVVVGHIAIIRRILIQPNVIDTLKLFNSSYKELSDEISKMLNTYINITPSQKSDFKKNSRVIGQKIQDGMMETLLNAEYILKQNQEKEITIDELDIFNEILPSLLKVISRENYYMVYNEVFKCIFPNSKYVVNEKCLQSLRSLFAKLEEISTDRNNKLEFSAKLNYQIYISATCQLKVHICSRAISDDKIRNLKSVMKLIGGSILKNKHIFEPVDYDELLWQNYNSLALIYFISDRLYESIKYLNKYKHYILETQTKTQTIIKKRVYHLNLGDCYYGLGQYDQALINYVIFYDTFEDKSSFPSFTGLITCLVNKSKRLRVQLKFEDIKQEFIDLSARGDEFPFMIFAKDIKNMMINQDNLQLAYKLIEMQCSNNSHDSNSYLFSVDVILKAYYEVKIGNYEECLRLLRHIVNLNCSVYNMEFIDTFALLAEHKPQQTLEISHHLVNSYPSNPVGNYCLAISFYYQQRYYLCEMYLKKALAQVDELSEKDQAEVYKLHAQLHAKFYRYNEALFSIDKAIELKGEDENSQKERIVYISNIKNIKDIEERIENTEKQLIDLQANKADILLKLEQVKEDLKEIEYQECLKSEDIVEKKYF